MFGDIDEFPWEIEDWLDFVATSARFYPGDQLEVPCPYCGQDVQLYGKSSHVYQKDYGPIWCCVGHRDGSCDARVGAHKGTNMPLGTPANAELRAWRTRAHETFDVIWKNGEVDRGTAYDLLAEAMQLPPEAAHIGYFTTTQCKKLIHTLTGVEPLWPH